MLDHVIVFGELHLYRLIKDYVNYYNEDRCQESAVCIIVMNGNKQHSGPWLRNGNIFHPNGWRPISSADLNMIFGASWLERSFFSKSNIE